MTDFYEEDEPVADVADAFARATDRGITARPEDEAPPALFSLPQRRALPPFEDLPPSEALLLPLTMRTLANLRNSGRVIE